MARCIALSLACFAAPAGAAAHEGTLLAALEEQSTARAKLTRAAPGEPLAPLRITLRDAASGDAIAGNVRITRSGGRLLAQDLAEPRLPNPRPNGWHASDGSYEVLAPREVLRVEAFQGLETLIASADVDLRDGRGAHVELALQRFASGAERGLAAGNTHVHVMEWDRATTEDYLRAATAADQLDFAWVSHLVRFDAELPYTTNEFTREDLAALSTPRTRFGWGQELRHNFAPYAIGYGHVLLLDLTRLVEPVSIGPILAGAPYDAPGLAPGMREGRAQGGTVIWAHGSGGYEDLPSWLLGRVDAQNLFDGGESSDVLLGDHATYARVYYPLLDVGVAVPFSTGTDWTIGDLARAYVPLPGERSPAAFLAQLRAGRSFITNGPLLDFSVAGEGPGGVVDLATPGALPVRANAIGRVHFGTLELIANGRVVAHAEAQVVGDHFEAAIAKELPLAASTWLAARVAPRGATSELGKPLFAHTSAVTVELAGARPFRSDVARALVLEMDWNARTIRAKGRFENAAQAREVTAPYREAIDALAPRMTWRDRLHAWLVRALRTLKGWVGL